MANGWAAQTKWLSDQTYYSERPGIWTDKITRRDRASGVTDRELKQHRPGLADGSGNLPPRTKREAAQHLVEQLLNRLPPAQRQAVLPRTKWQAVELLAAGCGAEALALF